jgi:methylglyoxal synthase
VTTPDREQLIRLTDAAHQATIALPHDTDARALYVRAATAAEQTLPVPMNLAVAAVLAVAAEHRRVSGVRGSLGESHAMLALALAVLAGSEQ